MARTARQISFDKDIRELEIKPNRRKRAVGNPKELYIIVYPSGMKTFFLKVDDKFKKIHAFCEGIYSVAEARKEANKLLKDKEKDLSINRKDDTFEKYFNVLIDQKRIKGYKQISIDRIIKMFERLILPRLENLKYKVSIQRFARSIKGYI